MDLRWGIIGPGKIAKKFAEALMRVPGNKLQAVASRDLSKAQVFASNFQVNKAYGSYENLTFDPEVDVVYVATPHTFHEAHSVLCLKNGKPVLCEKPMSVNVGSTQRMIDAAKDHHTFLMEAFWTRFMPVTQQLEKLIHEGAIGDLRFVQADFGIIFNFDATSRIFDLKLGGGSMLDVGVYPLFLALLLLGKPDEVKSIVHKSATGSDDLMNAILSYKNGHLAHILSSTNCKTPQTADIVGTEGSIHIPAAWWKSKMMLLKKSDTTSVIDTPYSGNGYEFEIEEVQRCLSAGMKESNLLPLSFSLMMSEVSESILKPHGVVYDV